MTDLLLDTPPLRYRRLGGGYRREDVEAALEGLQETVRDVEASIEQLRRLSARLGDELQAYRGREDDLEAVVRRAEDILSRAEAC
jgi:ABC-type transporter Mla subunit MlaD